MPATEAVTYEYTATLLSTGRYNSHKPITWDTMGWSTRFHFCFLLQQSPPASCMEKPTAVLAPGCSMVERHHLGMQAFLVSA